MTWFRIATVEQIKEDESLGVELEGKQLAVHHTGEPKSTPAAEPVKVYEVKIEGDDILVNL
jgi:3-phenylpropionate/trans-cinnamate dioxygenase ferredoxin subunit